MTSSTPRPPTGRLPAGVGAVLVAAVLFGAATPLVKVLSVGVGANIGAALLYLGSGVGVLSLLGLKRWRGQTIAPIPRAGRWRFGGAILAGGVAAPVLLVLGLRTASASSSSLLLNLEGVLTAIIAWVVFRENVDRRVLLGMVAIVAGGGLLSVGGGVGAMVVDVGALFIALACVGWAIDNNLTAAVSSADPLLIAGLKGLVAGLVNLVTGLALSQPFPAAGGIGLLMVAGALGYGISLALFVVGLRHLGTARTGAYFGAAPFIGAALSVVFLGEPFGWRLVVAAVLMGLGLWLHLSERHDHEHVHGELEHTHAHTHDDHHRHDHGDHAPPLIGGSHTHAHRHAALTHSHAHTPDLHHRHDH